MVAKLNENPLVNATTGIVDNAPHDGIDFSNSLDSHDIDLETGAGAWPWGVGLKENGMPRVTPIPGAAAVWYNSTESDTTFFIVAFPIHNLLKKGVPIAGFEKNHLHCKTAQLA